MKITTDKIIADERTQLRAEGVHPVTVCDYADAMEAGDEFPPLVVYQQNGKTWLSQGHHRLAAYQKAGIKDAECEVREGGLRDAILDAAGANAAHGLRRSSADKRKAVRTLLRDKEWGAQPDQWIADACHVHRHTVMNVRHHLVENGQDSGPVPLQEVPRKVKRGGKEYEMDTTNIGKKRIPKDVKKKLEDDGFTVPEGETEEADDVVFRMGYIAGVLRDHFGAWSKPTRQRVARAIREIVETTEV